MAVLVWSDRDGVLGNTIRSGRRVSLSAEEYRAEAEALDLELDALLDMAWHTLTLITKRENGKARFNSFEQVWVLGRAVHVSEVMRHEALRGEARVLLWQALTAKAWYGIRHNTEYALQWRELVPRGKDQWRTRTDSKRLDRQYDFLEIGYWLREQQLHDAGELFGWKYKNSQELYRRTSLRSVELRDAFVDWLRRQTPEVQDFAKTTKNNSGFILFAKALRERFPAKGPGSALLPQHYPEDELRAIVCETLDAARYLHFPHLADRAS